MNNKKAFLVAYVAIGSPIPDATYPEYNAGYEVTEHSIVMYAVNKDEILESFAGSDTVDLKIIALPESIAETAAERDRLKAINAELLDALREIANGRIHGVGDLTGIADLQVRAEEAISKAEKGGKDGL